VRGMKSTQSAGHRQPIRQDFTRLKFLVVITIIGLW
jgi:hypothetical protein